jgi:hypothetical protein
MGSCSSLMWCLVGPPTQHQSRRTPPLTLDALRPTINYQLPDDQLAYFSRVERSCIQATS